jgi:signal transduction histidine kinase
LDTVTKHLRMAESLRNRLTERGITLSTPEIAIIVGMIREEILQRHVIARGRVNRLKRLNGIKEKILDHIFVVLGKRQAFKMKGLFDLLIPALADIMKVQRCALFSVMENVEQVILEAGYPEGEHGIGQIFSVKEPYIDAVVNLNLPLGDFENETVRKNYIFMKYPQQSDLIPDPLKYFFANRGIHSVLYVPLRVGGMVKHFLAFDSQNQYEGFSRDEIDILTFFGKELTKALKLEKMGDILHDFRNPAIAAAAFSRKVKAMLQQGFPPTESDQINRWLDIVVEETSRIEELALTLHGEGKEEIIDLADRLRKRLLVNAGAVQGLGREKVRLVEQEPGTWLPIRCFPLHIDRVLDNLLNNATQAIPEEGGELFIQSYQKDAWAVAEIMNDGRIAEEDRERLLQGDGRGRGLHTSVRLIKRMGGKLDVEVQEGRTIFRLFLPIENETGRDENV